jgi:phosphoribosylcarboxyaminoimidazole (NCAIR) mutase
VSISPKVAVAMGSESDREVMEEAARILTAFGVPHEMRVIWAHRTPEKAHKFGENAA